MCACVRACVCVWGGVTERDRDTERETYRDRERQTDRQTDRDRQREAGTGIVHVFFVFLFFHFLVCRPFSDTRPDTAVMVDWAVKNTQ